MTAPAAERADRPRKRRVFVVDDHPIIREGLALLVNREPALEVCGEAPDPEAELRAIPHLMKGEATTTLLEALRTVLRDEIYVSPRITRPGE